MKITLTFSSEPRTVHEVFLTVPSNCTVGQALKLSGWVSRFSALDTWPVGIWNRKATRETLLREGDRVELYRPLRVDPKVARRERFQGQGARGAGLFSQRRPHSKAGY